ncbi:TIGR01212 family radical SAM protein [Thermosyntropha sp.]|uniref:TIGR01212 family radical SAM protein n=1 Tax=Thermosyntropha sp. TaxID=2740820 RepID=UPI0025ECDC19|nr:TIGR01212 family radical SAM protein [Thermosyntropha sp.]MBO8158500.1 TIGR01212 family radical SAM protein [Thermosyntropha sp.]
MPLFWDNKRYHSLNYHLRYKFGQKVFKLPLDAGFTCPNRDGTLSREGCYFCSARGSGDFAGERGADIRKQIGQMQEVMHKKWKNGLYIAYFQAFTNTYAPVERLRILYDTAISCPGVVGLAIATRPDCLPDDVLDLLAEFNQQTYLWVELGLQTVHEKTSRLVNLGYTYDTFLKSLSKLNERKIEAVAHIILGLPGETEEEMLTTGKTVASLPIQGLKIHLLHLMKGTPLMRFYEEGKLKFLTKEEYVRMVVDILEYVPENVVIHRLTGDSPRDLLVGPKWSLKKWEVLNSIDEEFIKRNTWQGRLAL